MHIKRISEMLLQCPTASEIYNKFLDLSKGHFGFYAKKEDKDGKKNGLITFTKPGDRIIEFYYDKKTDKPYSIMMYNDTKNATNRNAITISDKEIERKTSDEIALEIFNYLQYK